MLGTKCPAGSSRRVGGAIRRRWLLEVHKVARVRVPSSPHFCVTHNPPIRFDMAQPTVHDMRDLEPLQVFSISVDDDTRIGRGVVPNRVEHGDYIVNSDGHVLEVVGVESCESARGNGYNVKVEVKRADMQVPEDHTPTRRDIRSALNK